MKHYWSQLNERERWMLGVGGFFCLVYLIYLMVFAPLHHAVQQRTQHWQEQQQTLAWMQQARVARQGHSQALPISSSKLLAVLATQLNTQTLKAYPYQLQQTAAGDLQLRFEQVPYSAFMTWLWTIHKKYTITLKQLTLERTETVGVVKVVVLMSGNK